MFIYIYTYTHTYVRVHCFNIKNHTNIKKKHTYKLNFFIVKNISIALESQTLPSPHRNSKRLLSRLSKNCFKTYTYLNLKS